MDITEGVYYDVIRQKTASLIASCCAAGASSAGKEKEDVNKAKLLGEKIGMAFQIKDDLFDYGEEEIGKPTGIDIKEKKMTLPLIYTLNNSDRSQKRHIINLVKRHSNKPDKVAEVIGMVKESGGIEYTKKVMLNYVEEANAILSSFEDTVYKDALKGLVQYTIERTK